MIHGRMPCLAISLVVVVLGMPGSIRAWDPGGTLIDNCEIGLIDTVMISDGQGGAYIAWVDKCDAGQWETFCQRIDGDGNALWPEGGVSPISAGYSVQLMLTDDGGVIVSGTGGGLQVQRLTPNGVPVWPEPVNLWTGAEFAVQRNQVLCPDGAGGVVIAFFQAAPSTTPIYRIAAQRLDDNGALLWGNSGVTVFAQDGVAAQHPNMVATSDDGYAIVWDDSAGGPALAQKMNADGQMLWPVNGIPVASSDGDQRNPQVLPAESGGCFVFWRDRRTIAPGLYGQRLDALGDRGWAENGLRVDGYDDSYPDFDILSDGAGGTILAWQIGNTDPDLYAQRINGDGGKAWGDQARLVVVADGGQKAPHLAADGSGGAYLAWRDSRRGCEDIFAQHLSSSGDLLWEAGGVTVAAFDGPQDSHEIVSAATDSFIAIWTGYSEPSDGLHALRIGSGGSGVTTECVPVTAAPSVRNPLRLIPAVPNPFNPRTTISFELGEAGLTRLTVYDVRGRPVAELLNETMTEGRHSVVWEGRNRRGEPAASGIYFLRLEQSGQVDVSKVALIK